MNKKHWFGFNIFVLMFSSMFILFFHFLAVAAPFITIPNLPKEMMYVGVAAGYGIALFLAYLSVSRLYHMTKIS